MKPRRIYIVLMDDPVYKQSSLRVAGALARAGYEVTMVGRASHHPGSATQAATRVVRTQPHGGPTQTARRFESAHPHMVRLRCLIRKGKVAYAEMNLRIFFYLLFHRVDLVCAVNLDTILPCYGISVLKRIPRLYDARELFTEMAEVVARPRVRKTWLWVERTMVPRFPRGYAVCQSIAEELERRYGVRYGVIRNMTVLKEQRDGGPSPVEGPYLLYQGAVNHGRGLDALMGAMRRIDLPLVVCGAGNYMQHTLALVERYGLKDKVRFTGQLRPEELRRYTEHAYIGINLVEREGFNQYYSLPNKLFDYIHAALPQVTMDYPEYRRVQEEIDVAVLIPDVTEEEIVQAVQRLRNEPGLYERLRENCREARLRFNWQAEEPQLFQDGLYAFAD